MDGDCTARTLRVDHWSLRRIPHTLPALLAPLPALPLRHRTPCDARQGRRLRLAAPARLLQPPVTWRQHRAWSHLLWLDSPRRNPVLAVRRRALVLIGREGYG